MFDDFTVQVQSDEFASRYVEMQELFDAMARATADDIEMSQAEAEWDEWARESFPTPTDEELNAMERDYDENYGR